MLRSQNFFRVSGVITVLIIFAAFACSFVFLPAEAAGNLDHARFNSTSTSEAPSAVFPANPGSLGAIPDSNVTSPACQNDSTTFKDVTFTVTGLTGTVSTVAVDFNAAHTYVQDLEVTLMAPGAQNHLLFSATGTTSTAPNACAANIDLSSANTYTFTDTAVDNWWISATVNPVPTSTNRTVVTGIGGVKSGFPDETSLNSAFAGASPNGTWTLRFRDRGAADVGTVTAANLTVTTGAAPTPQHIVDFNGDGTTDFSVVRNTGGGPTGQVTWFQGINGAPIYTAQPWGIATDFFVPADFDGDDKTDIAVWRPGAQAFFYIFQSMTSTVRAVPFGVTGDDPTVAGDYTGDGTFDPAVYRAGAAAGDRSFWYYLASSGPLNGQIVVTQWGQNGDFVAPGDYNGDGKADFCIQRPVSGAGAFFEHDGTGGPDVPGPTTVTFFGNSSDLVVPGDYDGDGKTDIAVARGSGGQINWYYDPSSIPGLQVVANSWGLSATDFPTQGDYDGDGRTDVAVWRPSATPGQTSYYYFGSTIGVRAFQWGQNGDYPVANYNSH